MKVFPLNSISVNDAKKVQFEIIDKITQGFEGHELLNKGDLGVKQPENQPLFTLKTEKVIAKIFNTEMSKLVTGSGTGAIRFALHAVFENAKNRKILIHKAPIYPTTKTSFEMSNLEVIEADFNNIEDLTRVIEKNIDIECALVQISRQMLHDSYSAKEVIEKIKNLNSNIKVITDDNYAVFKTGNIGTDFGADLATFSTFKISGPEGIGCVIGKKELVNKINKFNYSGGSQVQGWQAYEVLQGMIISPVMLAIQAEQNEEIIKTLGDKKIQGVKNAFLVNAQSKVVIVELDDNLNAQDVLLEAEKLGALPNPVGAESKYEFVPLFYRVSSTFRNSIPNAEQCLIRINPNKAGCKTVLRILERAIKNVLK